MSNKNYYIKFASEDDVPLILNFIKGLAQYEKLEHELIATEAQLRDTLFGDKAYAEVIIGYYNKQPVSFALFFHNYSTFLGKPGIHLEDFYVIPEMQGKGFGKNMLVFVARLAVERDCGRLEWSVLNWNQPAIKFYQAIGAKPMEEWTSYRLDSQALKQLGTVTK